MGADQRARVAACKPAIPRSDECFVPSGQVEEDQYGVMVARGTAKRVEWVSEPNYRFKLSEFKDPLRGWLKDIDPIRPIQYQQDMLKLLDGDLQVLLGYVRCSIAADVPVGYQRVETGLERPMGHFRSQ